MRRRAATPLPASPSIVLFRNMKRNSRPFAVEIKGARKRAANHAFGRLSSPSRDVRGRPIQEDLAAFWASSSREIHAGSQGTHDRPENHARAPDDATAAPTLEPQHRRVLPDLREVANNEKPKIEKARRPRKSAKPDQVSKATYPESDKPAIQLKTGGAEPLLDTLPPPPAIQRKQWRGRKGLPRGESWKQRRLPPICWR
jgi:hypothetical protein